MNLALQDSTDQLLYTTYNIRRDADTINTWTYPDVMVTSPETGPNAQPYWYAHVIGIFHAIMLLMHLELEGMARSWTHMDFLWVQWFGMEPGRYCHGLQAGCLPKIGFVELTDKYAFTFLDPGQAIRGAHLIPAFAEGRSSALLPAKKSATRVLNPDEEDDWLNFYINMRVVFSSDHLLVLTCNKGRRTGLGNRPNASSACAVSSGMDTLPIVDIPFWHLVSSLSFLP
jgi:hypothetical protein